MLPSTQRLLSYNTAYFTSLIEHYICAIQLHSSMPQWVILEKNLLPVCDFLKSHSLLQYSSLIDIAVTDHPSSKFRYTVAYILRNYQYNSHCILRLKVNQTSPVKSVTSLFLGANWLEREAWDMFGIFFTEHPDLRRLLNDYGFPWHPLQKDFPVCGFIDLFYKSTKESLVYKSDALLSQNLRNFRLNSGWGAR